jgi:hypothetical protein
MIKNTNKKYLELKYKVLIYLASLHGCESWSLPITKMFVSRTLETKTGGVTVRQKNVGNDNFPNFCSLPKIIKVVK